MDNALVGQFQDHRRQWRDCLYVYPVIARRSKGVSIGVNLNLDKRCNFACVYCQVDRHVPREGHQVQLPVLHDELSLALRQAKGGQLWQEERFAATPKKLRRVNDIAFSGDGEPTCLANFHEAVAVAAAVKKELALPRVKLVVITNATQLRSRQVQLALPILDANNGEIWAKLDAGSDEYFRRVNRPAGGIALQEIVDNITAVAVGRPIVIQTLLMTLGGAPADAVEIEAYCGRLRQIIDAGGRIPLVQLHTLARKPAEQSVGPVTNEHLAEVADRVRSETGLKVETYGSAMPGVTR